MHIDNWRKFLDWVSRRAGTHWPTRITVENTSASAYTIWNGVDSGSFTTAAKKGIDPNYQNLMWKLQEQMQRLGKVEFTMNMQVLSIPKMRVLSTIHSAFLMMFYCFGYEYALSPEADIVRKIILEEQEPWPIGKMESYSPIIADLPVPSAGVIRTPKEIKSFVVILPCPYTDDYSQVVILPGFNGMKTYANYLNKRHKNAKKINFNVTVTGGSPNRVPSPKGFCKALWNDQLPNRYVEEK